MSRMKESCHVWRSRVTYAEVMSHPRELCHVERVISHIRTSFYTPYPIHQPRSTRHVQISHVTYKESCHIWKVISHVCMSPWVTTHRIPSTSLDQLATYKSVMSHIRSHVTFKKSFHTCAWVTWPLIPSTSLDQLVTYEEDMSHVKELCHIESHW